jgi:hypothetical protein
MANLKYTRCSIALVPGRVAGDSLPENIEAVPELPNQECFNVIGQLAPSRLLFLAEFLETRIAPEWIEHRIEPK